MLEIKIVLYLLVIISIVHYLKYAFHSCKPSTVHCGRTYLFSRCSVCRRLMPKAELIEQGRITEIFKEFVLSSDGLRWRHYKSNRME